MKTVKDCRTWQEAIRSWIGEGATGEEASRIQEHLAGCAECRRYTEELRAAAAGLRWMAERPVEPSPGFRARWMRAVEEAAEPRGFGEIMAAVAGWWRGLLLENLRPALAVSSVWVLILVFRLSAPEVSPTTRTTAARSPAEIRQVLKIQEELLAGELGKPPGFRVVPRSQSPARPRSEGLPAEPAAQKQQTSIMIASL
ncbi:MAG TPA: zf-HC2 domain-containing protein [Candidatus Paceibacterota bacterium]|nr:zf-HC2 domain-containing protein [Verrucomicrobiota bacterium]HSA11659.1 zf-HC2 domain-containing protein [Candidatus Paceibacterota bacterium]